MPTIKNTTSGAEEPAIHGVAEGSAAIAVFGQGAAVGVRGDGASWHGVAGISTSTTGGAGVHGTNNAGAGVIGESKGWVGVYGKTESTVGGPGVMGEHVGDGVGCHGKSVGGSGVYGLSKTGAGVWAVSESYEAVHAETSSPTTAAVAAYQSNAASTGAAIYAKHAGTGLAALLDGNVFVSGHHTVQGNMDCTGDVNLVGADVAEEFEVDGDAAPEPGTVMVLAGADAVRVSDEPYDRRVAGIVSGAGTYRPGLVLDRRTNGAARCVLALSGKVWVMVDADRGPVEVGDLLTTSPTRGHAMRVDDGSRALGTVIGKALDRLPQGRALIRMLVALQ